LNPLFDILAKSQCVAIDSAGTSPYSSIFAHANIAHFGRCIPPLELFKHGARLLGKIHLPLMSTPKHVCWELLDYLIEQRSDSGADTSNLPPLRLAIGNTKENPRLLWSSAQETSPNRLWFAKMFSYAMRLHRLGVMIVDMSEKSVMVINEDRRRIIRNIVV
jgi:hypothetical protein